MAGYLPRCFLLRVYGQDGVQVHKHAKRERRQFPAILSEQACLIKDFLFGKRTLLSCGTQRVIPNVQNSAIWPARVANHSTETRFVLPTHGANHIIRLYVFNMVKSVNCWRIQVENYWHITVLLPTSNNFDQVSVRIFCFSLTDFRPPFMEFEAWFTRD